MKTYHDPGLKVTQNGLAEFLRDEAKNKAETEYWHDQLIAWADYVDELEAWRRISE